MPHSTHLSVDTESNYSDEQSLVTQNMPESAPSLAAIGTAVSSRQEEIESPITGRDIIIVDHPRRASVSHSPIATEYTGLIGDRINNHHNDNQMLEDTTPVSDNTPTPTQLRARHSMNDIYQEREKKSRVDEHFRRKVPVSNGNIRERVEKDSPVIGELKTNVIVKDEFTLVTDLTYNLAARYGAPEAKVLVKIDHSSCLALGGAFDPCYVLTISSVSSQTSPAMNKRNASFIQAFMAEILSVPAERGIVKFESIDNSNIATNGHTVADKIERLEKRQSDEYGTSMAVKRAIQNAGRKSATNPRLSPKPESPSGGLPLKNGMVNGNHRSGATSADRDRIELDSRHKSIPEEVEPIEGEIPSPEPTGGSDDRSTSRSRERVRPATSDGLRLNGISDGLFTARPNSIISSNKLVHTTKAEQEERGSVTRSKHIPLDAAVRPMTATTAMTITRGVPAKIVQTVTAKSEPKMLVKHHGAPPSRSSSLGPYSALDVPQSTNSRSPSPARSLVSSVTDDRYDPKVDARPATAAEKRVSAHLAPTPSNNSSTETPNSAKRRSTVTITSNIAPKLPPVPSPTNAPTSPFSLNGGKNFIKSSAASIIEGKSAGMSGRDFLMSDRGESIRETRSLREATKGLLGKRKSFLKAFRRSQQQVAEKREKDGGGAEVKV